MNIMLYDDILFVVQFGGILLDRCVTQMLEEQNLSEDCNQMISLKVLLSSLSSSVMIFIDILIVVLHLEYWIQFSVKTRGGISEATTRTINTDKFTPSGLNR